MIAIRNPTKAPKNEVVRVIPVGARFLPPAKRKPAYAINTVQTTSRGYMGRPPQSPIVPPERLQVESKARAGHRPSRWDTAPDGPTHRRTSAVVEFRRSATRCALLSSSPRTPGHTSAILRRAPMDGRLALGIRDRNFDSRAPSDGQRPVR